MQVCNFFSLVTTKAQSGTFVIVSGVGGLAGRLTGFLAFQSARDLRCGLLRLGFQG